MGLTVKPKDRCRWDLVSLGEVIGGRADFGNTVDHAEGADTGRGDRTGQFGHGGIVVGAQFLVGRGKGVGEAEFQVLAGQILEPL